MRHFSATPLRYLIAAATAAIAAMAAYADPGRAAAARLPTILERPTNDEYVDRGFVERPATIIYTENTTRLIGGTDAANQLDAGHLTWSIYTSREAFARGLAWITVCDPDCDNPYRAVPASVRAFAPRHGRFTRLTLKYTYRGKAVVDRVGLHHFPTSSEGRFSHWGYVAVSPKPKRCGTVGVDHGELGSLRGVVKVVYGGFSCATAMRVARKANSRGMFGFGDRLPAPRGWTCNAKFRPTVEVHSPFVLGCWQHEANTPFNRGLHQDITQIGVRPRK